MTTHETIEAARSAAKAASGANCIVEIDHATEGRCYIVVKTAMKTLETALRNRPIPEIQRIVAEHSIFTAAEIASAREEALREHSTCERCGVKIDGNTAYSQQESWRGIQVTAHYCDSCRVLLSRIGEGEYTELQERASARPGYEPYTKED